MANKNTHDNDFVDRQDPKIDLSASANLDAYLNSQTTGDGEVDAPNFIKPAPDANLEFHEDGLDLEFGTDYGINNPRSSAANVDFTSEMPGDASELVKPEFDANSNFISKSELDPNATSDGKLHGVDKFVNNLSIDGSQDHDKNHESRKPMSKKQKSFSDALDASLDDNNRPSDDQFDHSKNTDPDFDK